MAELTPPSANDGGGTGSTPPELTPSPTWRKKPSQKGKPRLRLVQHARTTTPKPPVAPPQKKRKAAGDGVAGESPKPVRRKLDLDGERRPPTKISAPAVVSGSFSRATLMENLRSLAKLHLGDKKPPRMLPASSPKVTKPAALPPKIDPRRSFSRAQLMENLRSLAKRHNLPAAAADDDAKGKSGSLKKEKKPTLVDELVLVPYNRKRAASAAAAEDPFRALVIHDELAGALALRWKPAVLVLTKTRVRLVKNITPAIEAAYGQLMQLEETCRGTELPDIHESPELEQKRKALEGRVQHFMKIARLIMGDRKFDYEHPWGGTVLTSVVGTFLTQNVTDHLSSNAFMNLAAEFSLSKNRSNVEPRTNVPLMLTDGSGLGESEPGDHGSADERGKCRDKGIEEFIASIRTGEISSWDRGRIRKLLFDRFESSTAAKIFHDIASIGDTSHWNSLLKEAYNNGYRKEESANETIDWDALLHAPFAKIAECIRDRGNQSQMALRILAFLVRIKRDHGSIDLEWLRHVPRAKAKRYLLSINGLGAKSVDCIRLLSLRHRAFPVDTNVARIVTRLGWVELQPLPNSQEFHLVNT
ncbi:DEMETER-like protein 2 [Setaria italica]|uniref:DEMETER-like protein 2 n=1 Tax=Setaria italica TaxID=4555 RepID=UPI000BE5F65C|nr:DEMETER-like protein 2 [Setaria italica]